MSGAIFANFLHIDYLGMKWLEEKLKGTKLTPRLIFDGIIKEAKENLFITCGNEINEEQFNEALNNC